jgi:hypothetical protein
MPPLMRWITWNVRIYKFIVGLDRSGLIVIDFVQPYRELIFIIYIYIFCIYGLKQRMLIPFYLSLVLFLYSNFSIINFYWEKSE